MYGVFILYQYKYMAVTQVKLKDVYILYASHILTLLTGIAYVIWTASICLQGPINWNRVPGSIRTVEEKDTFKRHLKTTLFQQNA